MAKYLDLTMDQGSSFIATLPPITKPDNTVQNLSGYEVRSYIRRSFSIPFAVALTTTIVNGNAGIIRLSLTPAQTAGINATRWVYDVVIEAPDGRVDKVFEGMIFVNPSVTEKPNTTLLTPFIPSDYGGI